MMIKWKHDRCILCVEPAALSVEHVISESLGGILTSRFLCRTCNSSLGAGFEAEARLAPELRRAATGLKEILAELTEKLETGAYYERQFEDLTVTQKLRKDGQLGEAKLEDGSLIIPENQTPKRLKSLLQKRGMRHSEIAEALTKWEAAPAATKIELGANVVVRKWENHPATPAYTEPPLNPLVPVKIAYEFAALLVGSAIYASAPGFIQIRQALIQQDEDFARQIIASRFAAKPAAFHGIAYQGNLPTAQFQVRLFGTLAYTVTFPSIGINFPRTVYTHRLNTGDECAFFPDDEVL